MIGDQARVPTLWDEYGDLAFEPGRRREAEAVEKDRERMRELIEELTRLAAEVGPRPADLPPEMAWATEPPGSLSRRTVIGSHALSRPELQSAACETFRHRAAQAPVVMAGCNLT